MPSGLVSLVIDKVFQFLMAVLECKEFSGGVEYCTKVTGTWLSTLSHFVIITLAVLFLQAQLRISVMVPIVTNPMINSLIISTITTFIIRIINNNINTKVTEKVLILSGLGLYIQRRGLLTKYTRFISAPLIKRAYIHEALLIHKTVFYLLIKLNDQGNDRGIDGGSESNDCEIIVPFKMTFLPLNELLTIRKQIDTLLNLK